MIDLYTSSVISPFLSIRKRSLDSFSEEKRKACALWSTGSSAAELRPMLPRVLGGLLIAAGVGIGD